jgi:polysaccharide deacetylase 2 family uncharacterized protein YibQ
LAKSSQKKRKQHKKKGLFSKKRIAIVLLAFFSAFAIVYGVSYFQLIQSKKVNKKSAEILMKKMKKMLYEEKKRLDSLPKYIKIKKLPPVTISKQKEIEKENHLSEIQDYQNSVKKEPKKPKKPKPLNKKVLYSGKPKLAIIIDDVAFLYQINLIKKIPFRVTPSFFPPTKRHPDTIALSKGFVFKMIHLPTEALSYGRAEPETLRVIDSKNKIRARIEKIKKWFPSVTYYNNHTGSKFTADYNSMDRLIKVMKDEKLHFVDSRTTAQTKAPEISKKYGLKLYSRNIFIDNNIDKKLIKKQLLKAVSIAKKRGYAIAIGHPHKNTLNVLIGAKNLLKDVDLVYLKDL